MQAMIPNTQWKLIVRDRKLHIDRQPAYGGPSILVTSDLYPANCLDPGMCSYITLNGVVKR